MARKRKAGGRGGPAGAVDDALEGGKRFKMNVNDYMDVANSEDEWDLHQDKVLLEGGRSAKRRRQEEEDELEDSEEEVLPVPDSDEDEEEYDEYDEYEENGDEDESEELKSLEKNRRVAQEIANGSESEDELDGESKRPFDPEDEEGWGADDAYGADIAENEEDAREIEAEAIRLQKKRLEGLTDADFGFDEAEWFGGNDKDESQADGDSGEKITELLSLTEVTAETSKEERLRILKLMYPEFEPLSREYLDNQSLMKELSEAAPAALRRIQRKRKRSGKSDELPVPTVFLKRNALSAYMAALAMYFALLTSPATDAADGKQVTPMDPKELRNHSIMNALVKHRGLWERARDLSDSEYESSDDDKERGAAESGEASVYYTPMESSFADRLPELMRSDAPTRAKKMPKAQKALLEAQAAATAKREARLKKLDEALAKTSELAALPAKRSKAVHTSATNAKAPQKRRTNDDSDSDFGDETSLTVDQALEKERRRKSLRFYTSQIAQKANKRSNASRNAGGDEDIPYRERLKDRQARLNAEAEARARKEKAAGRGDELGGDSSDDNDGDGDGRGKDPAAAPDADEEYYQTILSKTRAKQAAKKAHKEALLQRAPGPGDEGADGAVGADGKRAIGYTIEKNKGLSQARRKDVRNPRVKKRRRFEDRKKKLGSMRAVYKGGEARGGYAGELTGIKKNLVRSVKL